MSATFEAAALAARAGDYVEALALLDETLAAGACSEADALDLRARVYAQQGLLVRAESCWRRAQELDPENPDYARGLAWLRGVAPGRVRARWAAGAVGAAVLLLAGTIPVTWARQERLSAALAETSVALERLARDGRDAAARDAERIDRVSASVAELRASLHTGMGGLLAASDSSRRDLARTRELTAELLSASAADRALLTASLSATEDRLSARLDETDGLVLSLRPALDSLEARVSRALVQRADTLRR